MSALKPESLKIGSMNIEQKFLEGLFPKVREELLRLIFCNPLKQRYVRELTNMSGLALHTVKDELRKLDAVGLVTSWSNGYHRFYRANRNHALFRELLLIVEVGAKLPRVRQHALLRPSAQRA